MYTDRNGVIHVYRHISIHVYRDISIHVYRHISIHVYRHISIHVYRQRHKIKTTTLANILSPNTIDMYELSSNTIP